MPREHTEFIQSQVLPWQVAGSDFARPGTEIKQLSADPDSGACSLIVRYPNGWSLPDAHVLLCDEELFVLDGVICINDRDYGKGDYAFLPALYPRDGIASATGAVVLTFFEGRPASAPATGGQIGFDENRLIERVATSDTDWIGASDPKVASERVQRLVLKPDSLDGDRSWLLRIDATDDEPFQVDGVERHPCVEEMLLLDGSLVMTCGLMRQGAYFWRPPMIAHGPMGTKHGFVGLFRAKEGSFSTEWSAADQSLPWDAAYDPVLPANLQRYTNRQFDSAAAY